MKVNPGDIQQNTVNIKEIHKNRSLFTTLDHIKNDITKELKIQWVQNKINEHLLNNRDRMTDEWIPKWITGYEAGTDKVLQTMEWVTACEYGVDISPIIRLIAAGRECLSNLHVTTYKKSDLRNVRYDFSIATRKLLWFQGSLLRCFKAKTCRLGLDTAGVLRPDVGVGRWTQIPHLRVTREGPHWSNLCITCVHQLIYTSHSSHSHEKVCTV